MDCPFCGSSDTQVKDSRPCEDGGAIRRRRLCASCNARFTTFERVQLRELIVVKRHGRKSPFDRAKLERSLNIALRKRDVEHEIVSRTINELIRTLEQQGEAEITTETLGKLVMEAWSRLDQVAYIRYASVYRNLDEAKDFETFVENELS